MSDEIIGCPYTLARYRHVTVMSFANPFRLLLLLLNILQFLPKLHPCAVPPFIHQMSQKNKLASQRQPPLPSRFVPAQQSHIGYRK